MYLKLIDSEEIKKHYAFIEDFEYDDEYQLLILPKAECSFLDFMKIKYQEFQDSLEEKSESKFHMKKEDFVNIMKF